MGRYTGKLRDFTAMELAAIASQEAIRRAGVAPNEFDHAVFGNAVDVEIDFPVRVGRRGIDISYLEP